MDNNKRKFVDKFTMFAAKLGNEIHLRSLRDAFATMMPLYILAGLAVLLNNTVFTWIFSGDTLANVQYWGTVIANGTLNVSGLLRQWLVTIWHKTGILKILYLQHWFLWQL